MNNFVDAYKALTGYEPFPWQRRLYEQIERDNIPETVSIPTGLGKTSVIAIWLIALINHPNKIPRRLVYVVNRRTVVDQATTEIEQLRKKLHENQSILKRWFDTLAISTLRGQHADNHEWSANPSRPAVICGTVDMIGSRLLFNGYRIGFKSRPLHAGFLGQDVLLIHDEAHLEPAFQCLIKSLEEEQKREAETGCCLPAPRLRTIALSATQRGHHDEEVCLFTITPDDQEHPIVKQRIEATKRLILHPCDDENKQLVTQIAQIAWQYKTSNTAVLIFAHKVEDVEKIASELSKKLKKEKLPEQNVIPLTGTMRGYERDKLVQTNEVFARFMPSSDRPSEVAPPEETVWLVCTSAGEVGINLSADHLICDLAPFERMVQRFGRVNRFGQCSDCEIHVVHPASFIKKKGKSGKITEIDERRQKTLELLRALNGNASPADIDKLDPTKRSEAFSPEPLILPVSDILFDAWAMTTIRGEMPGRPAVEPYLHGIAKEQEVPQCYIAWREEVRIVNDDIINYYGKDLPQKLLDEYPLKPHEPLSDRTDRIVKKLQKLAQKISEQGREDVPVWFIKTDGTVERKTLQEIAEKKKDDLANCTILLPPDAGGLRNGMFDGAAEFSEDEQYDVADLWFKDNQQKTQLRRRIWDDEPPPEGMVLIRTIDTNPYAEELPEEIESPETPPTKRFWHWYVMPFESEDTTHASVEPIALAEHTDEVVKRAEDIVSKLSLPENLKQAIILAAHLHDLGKRRELWQRSIGNPNPSEPYAKPGKDASGHRWRVNWRSKYRHEFGSMLDVINSNNPHLKNFTQLDDEMKDLVLHLIAAHHGYARPYFPNDTTADPNYSQNECDRVALESIRRYARLQRRYGRWGLAYLESLLRAADWAGSAEPSRTAPAETDAKTKEASS